VTREEEELIGIVMGSSSTTPVVKSFSVNPGQVETFPLLSQIAKLYEKYRFRSLKFRYEPMVSQYATGGQTGLVILQHDTDASDAPPTTLVEVNNSDIRDQKIGYQGFSLPIPRKALEASLDNWHFVRPGGLPGSSDIKTYDVGNLNVVTYNNGTTAALGLLYVDYIVDLDVRVNENSVSAPRNHSATCFGTVAAGESMVNGTPTILALQNKFGASTVGQAANGLGATISSTGSITLPAGNYMIDWQGYAVYSAGSGSWVEVDLLLNGTVVDCQNNLPGAAGRMYINYFNTGPVSGSAMLAISSTDVLQLQASTVWNEPSTGVVFVALRILSV